MEGEFYRIIVLPYAEAYIKKLTSTEQSQVVEDLEDLRRKNFLSVSTKQLRGPIRELIFGNHRLTYFVLNTILYVVRGFRKKTTKTPRAQIEYAENIYKTLKESR